jgi:hypothetical protein
MPDKIPMSGLGSFRWNWGGWFGSQIGGTAWMLTGAAWLLLFAPWVGLIWLVGFALCNAVGIVLWRRRDRVAPYPALVILLVTIMVVGLLEISTIDLLRSPAWGPILIAQGREAWLKQAKPQSLGQGRLFLLIGIPVLLLYLRLMDRAGRRGLGEPSGPLITPQDRESTVPRSPLLSKHPR